MQAWDRNAALRVNHFIANSQFVQGRIRQYYARDSSVIYPPVDTRFHSPDREIVRENFYLAAGAMVSYKRFDLVVQAFRHLGRELVIAGSGPEEKKLRRLAGANVRFLGWVSDNELRDLYRRAR